MTSPFDVANGDEPQQPEVRAMILVVDDEPAVCEVIAESLSNGTFEVECAYSAEEALGRLTRGRVDLALIDWHLPGRPGVEIAKRFAAEGTAVIMMSGALDAEEQLAQTGFKVLQKPFRLDALVKIVADGIRGRISPKQA